MNGILDGKQHVATIEQCNMKWGGAAHGEKFRCALHRRCGTRLGISGGGSCKMILAQLSKNQRMKQYEMLGVTPIGNKII